CPRIVSEGNWDDFFMALSRGKRKEQRRYLRQLDDTFPGEWAWRVVESPEEVEATLAALIAFHQAKWEALDHAGGFADPAIEAFHHVVARRFLRRGWLRLLRLEIRGELVAALYTLRYGDRVYDFASGFDYAVAEHSPGQVLTHFSIQDALESGVRVYDFLRGAEQYKFRWGAEEALDVTLRQVCSPQARLALGLYRRLRAVWGQIKHVLPHDIRTRMRAALRRAR
ncbi:MAG: GNAT family N-acetyltransferase, partial [Anaerolineae bacterium]|nr:GNAT family N-acetyltransferase [Anaerolineae bacterium]